MPREVLLEHIEWDKERLAGSSAKLIYYYEQSLKSFGAQYYLNEAAKYIQQSIVECRPQPIELSAKFFSLIFYSPYQPPIQTIENGNLVFKQRSPKIVFMDQSKFRLSPHQRSILFRINDDIGQEMSEVYKVEVTHNPFCFTFPPQEYAKSREVQKAVLV
jgi:hypothetical protein